MMQEPWVSDLKERFDFNLRRVDGIVETYERLGIAGPGRQSVRNADLLRSAVVFLHAALEDLLRGIAEERLPKAAPEVLERIPLSGSDKPLFSFTLKDLAAFRSETVDSVIRRAVDSYLRYSNYNSVKEVANLLRQIGTTESEKDRMLRSYGSRIESMMSRRHLIVHRADHNPTAGRGQHPAASIRRDTVRRWTEAVRLFGHDLLGSLSRD